MLVFPPNPSRTIWAYSAVVHLLPPLIFDPPSTPQGAILLGRTGLYNIQLLEGYTPAFTDHHIT